MRLERLNDDFLKELKKYDFSVIKERKIGLVGSVRFKDYFLKIESLLQISYKKLVSICSVDGLFNKEKFSSDEWGALQGICIEKLKNQDAILVLDILDYVGSHTLEEIEYFREKLKKKVYRLSELKK
ncbi:MAG: hypothetical protein ACTSQG_07745 [Promethearchaeota archaeon]